MIPIIGKHRAVKVVGAALSDDVDRTASCRAGREIEVEHRDLNLLYALLRNVERRAAVDAVLHGRTIHGDAGFQILSSGDGDTLIVVPESSGIGYGCDADPRLEPGEFQIVPAIEWKLFHLKTANAPGDLEVAGVAPRKLSEDGDGLRQLW